MYNWRNMTDEQREYVLAQRKLDQHPWHSPPHRTKSNHNRIHIVGSCYEHKHIIGASPKRMLDFEQQLRDLFSENDQIFAWCILSNHWHVLVKTNNISDLLFRIGQFLGRISHLWNQEESLQGRKVWYNCFDRPVKSDKHFWATVNYIHHNPVHHGYTKKWKQWPFSSAVDFIEKFGEDKAKNIWSRYDISTMGQSWDPPEL